MQFLHLNPDPTTQKKCQSLRIRIPEPIFTGSTLILYAVFRKDQGAQVCPEPGIRCVPGPVQLEILRPKPGKKANLRA